MTGIVQSLIGSFGSVVSAATDAYFYLVTLLLPGNGTNGAQNNTFLDSSSNNFTITRNGNTTQGTFSPFSQTGWGNYFDGDGDYLSNTSPTSVIAPGTSNFTAEFWVYPTTDQQTNGYGSVLHIGNSSSGAWAVSLLYSSAGAMKLRFSTSTTDYDSTSTISTNQWYHIAVVRSGTGTNQTTVYVNGASSYSFTLSDNLSNSSGIYVGTTAFNPTVREFTGYVSNLRLTVGTALYTGTFTPSTTPLTTTSQGATATQVELLTCQDNRFIDNSSNNFSLTITGTPSVQAFSPFAPTAAYSASTNGGSGYFDGTGDYLSVGAAADWAFMSNTTAAWTIECWVYNTTSGATNVLFSTNNGTSASVGINVFKTTSETIQVSITRGVSGSLVLNLTTTGTLVKNAWNHLFVSYDQALASNNCLVYINGASAGTGSKTANAPSSSNPASALRIGTDDGSGNFTTGYISSIRVSNTVRSVPSGVPTSPYTSDANTKLLANYTNAGITDATAKNDLETVGNAQISTTQSKFGGSSMYFDGTGDSCYIPDTPNLKFGTGDLTIECWVYPTATPGGQGAQIIGRHEYGSAAEWIFQITSTSKLNIFLGASNVATSTGSISNNQWTHIACTRSGSSVRLFINGTIDGTGTYSGSAENGMSGAYTIGSDQGGDEAMYTGYIDDLRITKGYARYTANFTAPTAPYALQ